MRARSFEPTNVLSEYNYQDGTAYYESTRDAATHICAGVHGARIMQEIFPTE